MPRHVGDRELGRDLARSGLTILDAIDHPHIWAPWFDRNRASWKPWRAFLSTLFNLRIDPADRDLILQCTGRTAIPTTGFTEAWVIVGRRGGKSVTLALIACYLAVFKDWSPYLAKGEVGTIKVIAVDRAQARVIHRHCRAFLTQVEALAPLVTQDDKDVISLSNGIVIEVQAASYKSIRGYSCIACLLDEVAFLPAENSVTPDSEILAAARPAMLSIKGAMLLCASSPYAKRGELWNHYKRYYGRDNAPVLVWQAATRTMRPSIPETDIQRAYEADPASASAEYGAQFRSDLESFVSPEVVAAVVVDGRFELPCVPGVTYTAFCDAAGGSGQDSMTLAIAHRDKDGKGVLDCIREYKPPFSPEVVTSEMSLTLRSFYIKRIRGDRYAGDWPAERFKMRGITYEAHDKSKTDIYRDFLPLLNSQKVELLDHQRLTSQLISLEQKTTRGTGKLTIDHPLGSSFHDDVANAVAGALTLVAGRPGPMVFSDEFLERSKIPLPRMRNRQMPVFW